MLDLDVGSDEPLDVRSWVTGEVDMFGSWDVLNADTEVTVRVQPSRWASQDVGANVEVAGTTVMQGATPIFVVDRVVSVTRFTEVAIRECKVAPSP